MAAQEEYRTDYYMMNVRRYADSKNVSIDSAALEINRLLSDISDSKELGRAKQKNKAKKKESLLPLALWLSAVGVCVLSFLIINIIYLAN